MMERDRIPFLDLVTPHRELRAELADVFDAALNNAGFIGGPVVEAFEREFAAFCGVSHCIGVGSGTDALRFALMAAGVGGGDVVVTVPNTFIATTEAISQAGARPVFVDVDEQTCNLDARKLREYLERNCEHQAGTGAVIDKALNRRVAAVVPVHLYGQMADMDAILAVAEEFGLLVIEDACQAHGAEYFSKAQGRWRQAGSMGEAAAFSFYPGKNLGACGEAGAATTNNAELSRKIAMLRDHGQTQKYYHEVEGYNGRLDSIQAGVLRAKLKHLAAWTAKRRAAAARYRELFCAIGGEIRLPYEAPSGRPVYHLFVVRVERRNELIRYLGERGIGTGIHYPIPLHLQAAYRGLGYQQGDFPVSERLASEIISLPMFPQLEAEQQSRVVNEIAAFCLTEAHAYASAAAR